ncbi:MAG: acyl-ACP--UDP-N-acetylglucosamine O-acyltransferase [Candidatus Methylomirabilales bacterium]
MRPGEGEKMGGGSAPRRGKLLRLHRTAIVSPSAKMSDGVTIGPYSTIGENVCIGEGTVIGSHVVIDGWTEIGRGCQIFSHAVLGTEPQDLKFRGEKSYLFIGDHTVIREFATINRATAGGGGKTVVGNHTLIMAYAHIAHDCIVGDHVIVANAATLGGHVTIEDYAIVGGLSGVHQFCRIGKYALVGGCSAVNQDIPPFIKVQGNGPKLYGLNTVGLKRHNFSQETLQHLRRAYRLLFRSGLNTSQAVVQVEEEIRDCPEVTYLLQFIKSSQRGITR